MIFIADLRNTNRIGSFTAEIPSGFDEVTILEVAASNGKLWSALTESDKVRLKAENGGNELEAGEYVGVTFSAISPEQAGLYEWTAKGYEGRGCAGDIYNLLGLQPTVAVVDNHR